MARRGSGGAGGFSRAGKRAAAALALVAAVFSVVSLRRYGVTIDEPGLFNAGDRTLFALTHPGEPGALDYDAPDPPDFHTHFPRLPDPHDPGHYPVLPALVAAAVDATAGRLLGLGPVDGHHAGLALISIVLLALYALYACRLLGDAAGIAAAVALACFPTAVGHAFNDTKDWPCAGLYALTVLAAGVGMLERRPRQLWLAGVYLGLALSCKQNGAFAALTVALAAPFFYRLLYRGAPLDRRLLAPLLAMPYVGFAIFLAAWPWLWWGGLSAVPSRIETFVAFARTFAATDRSTFSAHPLRCLVFMTPP
ncbi:MAG TPA: glycosyltransferase family 39 protein, partial [Polyangia bacterium]|nr:glycosyltransferase family 39 protein [Polyangia bacterium]